MQYKHLAKLCTYSIDAAEKRQSDELLNFYTMTLYRLINGSATKDDAVTMRAAFRKYLKTKEGKALTQEQRDQISAEIEELATVEEAAEYKTLSKVNIQKAGGNDEL